MSKGIELLQLCGYNMDGLTEADRLQPTAADMAQATPIVTWETIAVCGSVTALLTVVLGVIGLIVGLVITGLVLRGNAQVRRFSIENAVEDRLEREAQR